MPEEYHCLRCGFEWERALSKGRPNVCPRCRNPRWNNPPVELDDEEEITQKEQDALNEYLLFIRNGGERAKLFRKLIAEEIKGIFGREKN